MTQQGGQSRGGNGPSKSTDQEGEQNSDAKRGVGSASGDTELRRILDGEGNWVFEFEPIVIDS